jgi:hypothetical protein
MSPRTEKGSAPPPPEHLGELGIVVHSLHDAVTSGTLLEWRALDRLDLLRRRAAGRADDLRLATVDLVLAEVESF